MSSDNSNVFTKDNLDIYLKELAKEFRKTYGKHMPAEIILIGGAAILVNYGFRDMTTDVDAVIRASSSMKEIINRVGDKFNPPNGWLNSDFIYTSSYSDKLDEISVYYRTYSNVLTVRTVSAEYLIAMKLRAGRKYKNDLSDIIGILAEHKKQGKDITMSQIDAAVEKLYGGWTDFPSESRIFIKDAIGKGNYIQLYNSVQKEERQAKDILIAFEKDYPNVAKESNVNEILKTLKAKKHSPLN